MAIGIWTPVEDSGVTLVFPDRLNVFADKVESSALAAGTHMKFTNLSNYPVFVSAATPTNDADGFAGTAISAHNDVVMPRLATVYVYSPYANTTVHISVGALT